MCDNESVTTNRTVQISEAEAALRDAQAIYDYALRHGNAGSARVFLRAAQAAVEAERAEKEAAARKAVAEYARKMRDET